MPIFRRWPVAPRLLLLAPSSAARAACWRPGHRRSLLVPVGTPRGEVFEGVALGRPRCLYFVSFFVDPSYLALFLCVAAPWFERIGKRLVSWSFEACWMPLFWVYVHKVEIFFFRLCPSTLVGNITAHLCPPRRWAIARALIIYVR